MATERSEFVSRCQSVSYITHGTGRLLMLLSTDKTQILSISCIYSIYWSTIFNADHCFTVLNYFTLTLSLSITFYLWNNFFVCFFAWFLIVWPSRSEYKTINIFGYRIGANQMKFVKWGHGSSVASVVRFLLYYTYLYVCVYTNTNNIISKSIAFFLTSIKH